jgi:Sigma-70 region 2
MSASVATFSIPAEVSDEIVMAQLGEGSKEALAILFRRYAHIVRSIAYRAVRDGSEADDLVQDIFLLVHRDARAFDCAKGSARAWILQLLIVVPSHATDICPRAISTTGLTCMMWQTN